MTPTELATKIARFIVSQKTCTYADIQVRADAKGISRRDLEAAMVLIHRNKAIKSVNAGGDIQYSVAPPKPVASPFFRYEPYPEFIKGVNDASHEIFAGVDMSYLFMTPEEALQYKAQLKGKVYVPRKAYERT